MRKIMLILVAVLAMSAYSAENCLQSLYDDEYLPIGNSYYLDSAYYLDESFETNDWSHSFYFSNGKYDSALVDDLEGGPIRVIYYRNSRAELSNEKGEIVMLKEQRIDSVIMTGYFYHNGELTGEQRTVWTKDTVWEKIIDYNWYSETYAYISNDTLYTYQASAYISDEELDTFRYNKMNLKLETYTVMLDPNTCLELYPDESLSDSIFYEYRDDGYTKKLRHGSSFIALFFKRIENPASIKAVRPRISKILPSNFDLLGRKR